jgi:hypothetical protein
MRRAFLVLTCAAAVGIGRLPAAVAADAVATVGGRTITRAELEARVKPKLIEIENERYEALKEGLDDLVAEELMKQEATARGVTPEALEKQEVDEKVAAPSDAEIQKLYDDNKAQLGGQTLEQIKPRIVQYLSAQKQEERRSAFVNELKAKHRTTVALRPPVIAVSTAGRPAKGSP